MPQFLSLLVLDERLRKRRYAAALAMFATIIALGSIPGARAEIGTFAPGLILHSIAYSCLALLLFTGLEGSRTERAIRAVLMVAAMGALDELVQSLLPYRVGSVLDWAVDCSAASTTAALLWAFLPAPVHSSGA